MIKDKIVFFTSGDFAIDTFESLLENGYDVVGLVTSNDVVEFHDYHALEVAERYGVPTYVVKPNVKLEDDDYLIDWLKRANADIYCVISFKKLPKKIVDMAKKCAFNVHASLLPMLRGAAPINWAIRKGYKETGLTAIVLDEKIDCGDIIANVKIKIHEKDKFTSLFKKLSELCIDFTKKVLSFHLQNPGWKECLIKQPDLPDDIKESSLAPKIDRSYFRFENSSCYGNVNLTKSDIDSVDNHGWLCKICVRDAKSCEVIKEFDAKIFSVENDDDCTLTNERNPYYPSTTESDGKTCIEIRSTDTWLNVKKLQINGKKIMDVKDFLNGFRYFNKKYITEIVSI